jgi:hypothetical protein
MKNIPQVNINFFGTQNEHELRILLKTWIRDNLIGEKYKLLCGSTNGMNLIEIELTWQGLKNDLFEAHPPYIEKLISFAVLPEIISNAIFVSNEPDKNNRKHILEVLKFKSEVIVEETEYDVLIVIYRIAKIYLYDHILLRK